MNAIIIYLLKVSLCTGVFYGLYWVLLRKETFFMLNRIYLLISLLLSFILPVVHFPIMENAPENPALSYILLRQVSVGVQQIEKSTPNISLADIIYLFVSIFIFIYLIYNILRIFLLSQKGIKKPIGGFLIIETQVEIAPFSFFNRIFIQSNTEEKDAEEILAHEKVHVRQWHTLDVLFTEALKVILWFNPFIYLYNKSLRNIHEYLADRGVLLQGHNTINYQQLLLGMAIGQPHLVLINKFNHSIKRRFIMMTKSKSNKLALLKLLLMMPLIAGMAMVFSSFRTSGNVPVNSKTASPLFQKEKKTTKQNKIYTAVEEQPSFPGGEEARIQFFIENIKYPEAAKKNGIHGTVFVSFIIEADGTITNVKVLRGFNKECDAEAARVVNMMPKWNPGRQRGKHVAVQFNMPIKFTISKDK
ncbi:MAG: M56 family metallopeptidase [Lentimicrobiaceae bacterium]|nr:M56 family metallopeptidase [Lentimicrobiaceae bacterium]